MFKIYFADMGKATNVKEMGKRPVVSVSTNGDKVKVYKVTSRNRDDKYHVRIDNYIVNGFCDVQRYYWIDKKYLLSYQRDCTIGEEKAIKEKAQKFIRHKKENK